MKCFCCGYSIPGMNIKNGQASVTLCDFILKCIGNITSVAAKIKAIDDQQTSNETKENQTVQEEQSSAELLKQIKERYYCLKILLFIVTILIHGLKFIFGRRSGTVDHRRQKAQMYNCS